MPAGQPQLDLAARLRHWLWYGLIKARTGLSDDDLDRLFAGGRSGGPRPRAFHRLRALGSSPLDRRGHQKTRSIYAAVHEGAHAADFESAKHTFDSPLWELLGTRRLSAARVDAIVADLVTTLGWARLSDEELRRLAYLGADADTLQASGLTPDPAETLALIATRGDADALALLCALYRQSLARRELSLALAIADAVQLCASRLTFDQPGWVSALLYRLVDDRILHDRWISEADFLAECPAPTLRPARVSDGLRRREVAAFVNWYVSAGRRAGREKMLGLPTPHTAAIDWVRQHVLALQAIERAVQDSDAKENAFADMSFPQHAIAIAERSEQLRSELRAALQRLVPASSRPLADSSDDGTRAPIKAPASSVAQLLERMDSDGREHASQAKQRSRERRAHYFGATITRPGEPKT